jgi:probable F420-dependent oxidoreductase
MTEASPGDPQPYALPNANHEPRRKHEHTTRELLRRCRPEEVGGRFVKLGLMVYTANEVENNRKRSYDTIRAIVQQAEADGFDSIWLPDHLLYRKAGEATRGVWESWTMLAALAEATQRVEIGTLVLCNSFRNPAILAKMATAADEVSHGRLILGIGAGWNEPEYQAFGLPFDNRVDSFEEALRILRPLLREGRVDFSGKYYQARNCENVPAGPRPEGPPLLVGGEGPRMLRLTARYADLWNTGYMGKPETMAKPLARIEAACREVGRDRATLGITALIGLWFPDLLVEKPSFLENPLTGTAKEIATAMRGYAELGVQHIIFQCAPYTSEARERLTEALQLYRGMQQ